MKIIIHLLNLSILAIIAIYGPLLVAAILLKIYDFICKLINNKQVSDVQ